MDCRIIATSPVNVRKGPGMVYEISKQVKAGTTYDSTEQIKDGGNILWYNTSDGWICGEHITLANDYAGEYNKTKDKIEKIKSAGATENVTESASEARGSDNNSSRYANSSRRSDDGSTDNILGKRAFGAPYNFLNATDIRTETSLDKELGMNLLESMTEAPIISVMPGNPYFLADLNEDERKTFIDKMQSIVMGGGDHQENVIGDILDNSNLETQLFTFQPNFVEYIRYVNTLTWLFAMFMGIGDKPVPGMEAEGKWGNYGSVNWARYTLANRFANRATTKPNKNIGAAATEQFTDVVNSLKNVLESLDDSKTAIEKGTILIETYDHEDYFTDFFINPNVSYSESFNNSTKESMLAGVVNSASDWANELAFFSNAYAAGASDTQAGRQRAGEEVSNLAKLAGENSILNKLLKSASNIIAGAHLAFPSMWQNSTFSRSYSIDIPLKTAYGTRESIFMDIIVPMCFWIALAAPRQYTINSYAPPFLVKFFIPGFCNVDMGLVESLTITKGGDGSAWSVDGLPLEVNLSINIADLYSTFSMSRINGVSPTDAYNFINNSALIDYVGVNGGLDMKKTEFIRKAEFAGALLENSVHDLMVHPGDVAAQSLTVFKQNLINGVRSAFGNFFGVT
jgi:hypothetical protein